MITAFNSLLTNAPRALRSAILFSILSVLPAHADPVYIELYTSQGCSSCPPADKILGSLAQRDDVIAVAFHVDYWDYIGWKDSFGKADHSARQRSIARARGERRVYTPQMMINGVTDVIGNRAMAVSNAIANAARQAPVLNITARKNGQTVHLQATPTADLPAGPIHVHILNVIPTETVAIKRGENAGRNLRYHNIVRNFQTIDRWSGQGAFSRKITLPQNADSYAVFQIDGVGRVLGAVKLN